MTTSERKSRKIYYTMGEVSEMFDVNPSLIRFWEQKFDILKPDKNKKGNRLFTPKDVENLKLIYHLVKENGMTLAGAAKRLRQNREGVSRDLEIIEKLQRVRSLLLDVREVLKADDDGREVFVDPAPADWDDVPASEYGMKSGGEPADNRMSEESSPRGEAIDDRAWPITDTPLRREADNSKPDSGEGQGAALVCEPRCAEVPDGLSELVAVATDNGCEAGPAAPYFIQREIPVPPQPFPERLVLAEEPGEDAGETKPEPSKTAACSVVEQTLF